MDIVQPGLTISVVSTTSKTGANASDGSQTDIIVLSVPFSEGI